MKRAFQRRIQGPPGDADPRPCHSPHRPENPGPNRIGSVVTQADPRALYTLSE